ncbi:MAG: GAF domain-containing protein [Anaerolineales bacterium]|nr:GAF domain-containing protein [Anaerolineales bacterium]
MDLLSTITLAAGALYLLNAVVAFWRRSYHPHAAWALLVYMLLSMVWSLELAARHLGWLAFLADGFLDRFPYYGLFALAACFLALTRAFFGTKTSLARRVAGGFLPPGWGWLFGLLWLIAMLVVDLNPFHLPGTLSMDGSGILPRTTLVFALWVIGWAVFMIWATVLIFQAMIRKTRHYASLSYWALVIILTVVGDGLVFGGSTTAGCALRLAGSMIAVYVIAMPRLPYFGHLVRRLLSFLIFTSIAVVLYTICLVIAQLILRDSPGASPLLAGLALAFFLVLIFDPVMRWIQKMIDWWIFGEDFDPTYLMRQYSQSITNILDLQLLATVAVGTASELMEVDRGFLFLVNQEKGADGRNYYFLRGAKGMGGADPPMGWLSDDSPLARFFMAEYKPVTQPEIDFAARFRMLPLDERAWLNNLDVEVFVPIHTKKDWIGLLCLGPKISGAVFTDQDLDLLSTIADQTAVALENTRLVEGLVRLNNDFRRAFSALDQANRHLERLDRTKSDFISIASHELRTPLTLISGSSQMLLDDPALQANSYHSQLLSKIHTGTVRLHEIVDSMLDMAKIDMRALELDTQPVRLNELVRSVYNELKKACQERKLTVELIDLKELPAVLGDKDALRKVFYHLVVNAIKYTPDGGRIMIYGQALPAQTAGQPDAEPVESGFLQGGVEIVVEDTGIGIDPRFQDLIFVKFYQTGELALHSSGKTKFKGGGSGLGLAIARGIVEAHQGKVWVESPGHDEETCPGSKFHVMLPLRRNPAPDEAVPAAPPSAPQTPPEAPQAELPESAA